MLLRLDTTDRRPLHEQVAAALRRAIADGSCPARLPPARELAAGLGVNPNTVLRALRDLRDEGLLEFRRGRGIRVAENVAENAAPRGAVIDRLREALHEAERAGLSRAEVVHLIQEL